MHETLREKLHTELQRVEVPPADFIEVVQSGRQSLWRRRVVAFALVAGLGAASVVAFTVLRDTTRLPNQLGPLPANQPNASSETTYRDPDHRYSVTHPVGWYRAAKNLSPHIEDPEEILSLATFEIQPTDSICPYSGALEAIRPNDAFLSVSESSGDLTSRYLVERPASFTLDQGYDSEVAECLNEPAPFRDRMIPFQDGSRFFFAYVALGSSADHKTQDEVLWILNSLEFDA